MADMVVDSLPTPLFARETQSVSSLYNPLNAMQLVVHGKRQSQNRVDGCKFFKRRHLTPPSAPQLGLRGVPIAPALYIDANPQRDD